MVEPGEPVPDDDPLVPDRSVPWLPVAPVPFVSEPVVDVEVLPRGAVSLPDGGGMVVVD